jgi:predicted negative regulator of RcsB-dependent stress response
MSSLVAADPQNAEWRSALVDSFHGIGAALAASGRRQEALAAYRESLAIGEKLAAEDPENVQRRRDLSVELREDRRGAIRGR